MNIKVCFYEDEQFRQFLPLTYLRPVYCMRAGIVPLFQRAARYFDNPDICLAARHALAPATGAEFRDYPFNIVKRHDGQPVLFLNGRLRDYADLPGLMEGARLVTKILASNGQTAGVFFHPEVVSEIPPVATPDQYAEYLRSHKGDVAEVGSSASLYQRTWEIVGDIECEIAADFKHLRPGLGKASGVKIHNGAHAVKSEQVYVGSGCEVLPGALIDATSGPVFLGDNTRVESQVAIYGPCYIGPNSVVAAGKISGCSIGHTCRAGGEIEGTVFQSYVNKYHVGFIGHSYVGSWVNFGALTTNSDLKNNYSTIQVSVEGRLVDTGSIKVGSFIGDHTKFGIGTLLNTGINVGVCCNLFGGTLITDREVPSFRWGNSSGYEVYRFEKAIETIRRTAGRRDVTLSTGEENLLRAVAESRIDGTGTLVF
jgi:UDP-N-acetylglucosamine diphosphorylase/glucosamine-1-phosphate N-acetyltransferase